MKYLAMCKEWRRLKAIRVKLSYASVQIARCHESPRGWSTIAAARIRTDCTFEHKRSVRAETV